jgi:Fic family protein
MDVSKFTENKIGRLIAISAIQGAQDHAFIPDSLPSKWTFDAELWPLLAEAKRHLGMLDGAARILPHPKLLLKPLQRVESLTSSRLEGTYATAQEVMLFEMNPKNPQNSADQSNAWLEVSNYNRALAQGYDELRRLPFCMRLIKDLHKTLMDGIRGGSRPLGEFRKHQVHIGSTRRYVPPPPLAAGLCMSEFEKYVNNPTDDLDPLVRCFLAHYQFEAIHPFSDGNGRIGRVVLSLMIYKWCDLEMPWLYLSPYFERYKDDYIDLLFKVSSQGAWSEWIAFCLRGVIDQASKVVVRCQRLLTAQKEMHERTKSDGGGRIHAIIDELFDVPMVRIGDLSRRFEVRYPTSKSDVNYLIEKQILAELAHFKIRTFYCPQIFAIAYEDETENDAVSEPAA